jgi:CheY-like chemotaxis protein
MNILYLEDNPNDAQLIKLYVESIGSQLKVVSNLDDFWAATPDQYDLILVDIMLRHGRAGLNVPGKLHAEGCDKPIIAVTGLTTTTDQQQCHQAGFTSILAKPYTVDQLAAVIPEGS